MQDMETGGPVDTASVAEAGDQLAAVAAERDQLRREKAELQDLLLRRQAEFDNFRKRSERERGEFAEYAGMDAVRALLPAIDDFERALKASGGSEEGSPELLKGIALIYGRLLESLKKLGLQPIEAADNKFDPHLHHAVERVPSADREGDTILEEYQRGYFYKGRLLRPAMVKVAVRSSLETNA